MNGAWEENMAVSTTQRFENATERECKTVYVGICFERGDVLVFNNQEMLHGRREFNAVQSAQRNLIGCYTDAMDMTSRYRHLLTERGGTGGGGYGKWNPGSGCRWF
jgi:alpha-ketoglutarate-dependent taurine dioxygenase